MAADGCHTKTQNQNQIPIPKRAGYQSWKTRGQQQIIVACCLLESYCMYHIVHGVVPSILRDTYRIVGKYM